MDNGCRGVGVGVGVSVGSGVEVGVGEEETASSTIGSWLTACDGMDSSGSKTRERMAHPNSRRPNQMKMDNRVRITIPGKFYPLYINILLR
jgi:hypothetical protein